MRVLCLRFPGPLKPSWVEAFLRFTPRVATREPGWAFLEVSSTQHLFGGEKKLLDAVLALGARIAGGPVSGAIADQAATAQALTIFKPGAVGRPGQDTDELAPLPLDALIELEGLVPWPSSAKASMLADFFRGLGFQFLGGLHVLSCTDLQERWGDWGAVLWKRIHARETHAISPWVLREPLNGYVFYEDPTALVPLLMAKLDPALELLFARLEGQGRFARALNFILHCEWSNERHRLRIEPVAPGRDRELFRDLLLRKLDSLDLENPVKEVEVEAEDVPEKIQQLDFFEPRDTSDDRWKRLISFASQGDVEMGFLQPVAALFAEESTVFKPAAPERFEVKDVIERQDEAIQVRAAYAKSLSTAPRPSLLLDPPRELDTREAAALKPLTPLPAERMTGPWWRRRPEEGRDYYYALSPDGRVLWVYRDKTTKKVFLQGAFD